MSASCAHDAITAREQITDTHEIICSQFLASIVLQLVLTPRFPALQLGGSKFPFPLL